ncbi:MAG: Wzz/FepE/Etk N-terminal domain-containing protein [Acidimicrobiales bacterium]
MTLREILGALWRRRLLLAVTTLISVGLAFAFTFSKGASYSARAQLALVQPTVYASGSDGLFTLQKLDLLVDTYAKLVASPEFVSEAARRASVEVGDASVTGDAPLNTSIVIINVRSSSGPRSAGVAAAIQQYLIQLIDQAQPSEPLKMTGVVTEKPVSRLASSNPTFTVFVALVAGLAIAATVALLAEGQ